MNANELNPISKIHIMRVYAGMANPEDSLTYEKWEEELRNLLDRSRIRDTATEPPTRKDGDECGCVLAKRSDLPYGAWGVAHRTDVRGNTNLYVQWTQLPEVQHDNV